MLLDVRASLDGLLVLLRPCFSQPTFHTFHGGQAAVMRATGLSHGTVRQGMREVAAGETIEEGQVRRPGGGARR